MTNALGPWQAMWLYQQYNWDVITNISGRKWELTREQVLGWVTQRPEQAGPAFLAPVLPFVELPGQVQEQAKGGL